MSHSRLGDSWVHICSRGTHLLHIMQPVKCAATMAGTLHCSNVITSLSHYNCAIQRAHDINIAVVVGGAHMQFGL